MKVDAIKEFVAPFDCNLRFATGDYKGIDTACNAPGAPKVRNKNKQCPDPYNFPEDCPLRVGFVIGFRIKE